MKVGHMDGMHCFIDSTSILVKIKSVLLYNCQTVYVYINLILSAWAFARWHAVDVVSYEIWGSASGEYEDCLLGHDTM